MAIGLANAPVGMEPDSSPLPMKPAPISELSAAACRASTVWIASAAARMSLFLMLPACPRYAAAPRFSTVAALVRIFYGPPTMTDWKLALGLGAGVPPSCLTAAVSASTCCCSVSPNFVAILPTAGSLTTPLAITSA